MKEEATLSPGIPPLKGCEKPDLTQLLQKPLLLEHGGGLDGRGWLWERERS